MDVLKGTRTGTLVAPGATTALLCVYPFVSTDPMPLGKTHTAKDPAGVAKLLNTAPDTPPAPNLDSSCLAGGKEQYLFVLGYPNRPPAVVTVGCGTVESGGVVRYDAPLKELLAFWPNR
ncbi:hypothetical protein SAMN05444365_102165 [Micromonospora pattaloongensis]|uniref:Uncharacterized protein n=1 Tax=Micromonospora pattaloongensis TaxID=405436 RepID=A0A1H3JL12_9ACTN|nr:hypothetical protein [Micromonospora pattaloongensis]SDY40601.1 hypothetical protein SAMN05444365_102165 [Micromonospora pattaloongensis]